MWTDAPDAPGEPEAQEVGNDFVSLTWQKPRSDGGGRIAGYFVEKKDANSDNWARINQVPSPATIFNVPNLIEEREYDFRVFAVNEAGESKPATTGRRILVKDPKGESFSLMFTRTQASRPRLELKTRPPRPRTGPRTNLPHINLAVR